MTLEPVDRVGQRRGLAVGLVLTITMVAFENLGVATAMPVVARDLDGVRLYGWGFTAPLLASLIGIVVAGRAVDRHGPGRPFCTGLALFSVGLAIAGSAGTMEVVVAGRFVQGLGTGSIPPVAYAAIAHAFTERARARMFALLSTAWVIPGVIGPAISGTVAEEVGWRWVFLGILPLAAVNAALAVPVLRRLGPTGEVHTDATARGGDPDPSRVVIGRSVALAAGVGLVVGGLGWPSPWALGPVAAGAVLAAVPLRRLLPPGTLVARRGLPAAVAARGLQTFAFFGAQAYLPLALTDVRGQAAGLAGLTLTAAALSWTAGAWLQERRGHVWGRARMVGGGFVLLTAGCAISAAVLLEAVPVPVAALGWAVAGLGMGMSYSGLSLLVLSQAAPGREGAATSSLQISDVLGMAVGTGLGGAAVAFGAVAGAPLAVGIAVAFALAIAVAAMNCVVARRLVPAATRVDVPTVG